MTIQAFLSQLESVKSRRPGRFSARCPAHSDKSPSLSITEGESAILLRCWAGCSLEEIISALNLRLSDLFYESGLSSRQHRIVRLQRIDHREIAQEYELAALDRRLRSQRFDEAARKIDINAMPAEDLDRLIGAAHQTHGDREQATLMEAKADDHRNKAFQDNERHTDGTV